MPLDLRPDQHQHQHQQQTGNNDEAQVRFVTSPESTRSSPSPSPPPRAAREAARRQRLLRDLNRMDHTSTSDAADTPTVNRHGPSESLGDDDNEQRRRLQSVLARLSRRYDSSSSYAQAHASSYSHRIPQPSQQSLYDWAPSQGHDQDDQDQGLDDILETLRSQNPSTHSDVLEFLGRQQLYRQRESDREEAAMRLRREHEAAMDRRNSDTLRSAAIMQNARSRVRSPNGTDRILRYLRNREHWQRADRDRDDPEPAPDFYHLSDPPPASEPSRADAAASLSSRLGNELRARVDSHWRSHLTSAEGPTSRRTPPASTPTVPQLDIVIQYLDALRPCSAYNDSLSAASLKLNVFFKDNQNDLVTSVRDGPRPAPSSLLQPGAIFEGTQNTAPAKSLETMGFRNPTATLGYTAQSSRPFDATRRSGALPPTMQKTYQDQWPVKVKIQAVDYEKMTVAGVMEAHDVPAYPSSMNTPTRAPYITRATQSGSTLNQDAPSSSEQQPSKRAFPITTFLEGQIIDLTTHSFLTPNNADTPSPRPSTMNPMPTSRPSRYSSTEIKFPPTTAVTDAANWRNLPPFNAMASDEEVARAMLSRDRMETIMSEWIFMRWKERCFIHSKTDPSTCPRREYDDHDDDDEADEGEGEGGEVYDAFEGMPPLVGEGDDQDTGHGLTISGFYYVSLRRADGGIEGLYFDTRTSPYQQLRLRSKSGGLHGAWGFK